MSYLVGKSPCQNQGRLDKGAASIFNYSSKRLCHDICAVSAYKPASQILAIPLQPHVRDLLVTRCTIFWGKSGLCPPLSSDYSDQLHILVKCQPAGHDTWQLALRLELD